jgi:solute:Na+ symporter, SSS family
LAVLIGGWKVLIWGLHVIDIAILFSFLIAILLIGVWVSRGVKGESDFYLSGRKMGRTLQFFLNFGNSTDTTGAVVMASEVYRQGVGGIWLSLQTLFITPFFWFTQAYLRRARVTTMADLFLERFGSKAVASAYAGFNIYVVLLLLGMGSRTGFEVTSAMVVKEPADYTQTEREGIDSFNEYVSLANQKQAGTLPTEKRGRFEELDSRNRRGELKSFVSYITPLPFYICYCTIVAIYIMLGGLKAAAITDAVQGILILIMSIMLIPLGLHHIGGVHALHQIVPAYKFQLFGTIASSEYTWYSIFAITLGSLIQILGLAHNMAVAGSAKDEDTARIGIIVGGFTKRLVLIAWMFCGLIAVAMLSGRLSEPDQAWGQLSRELLMPGLMGLMLSGMLLGHMPSVGLSSVAVSGLVTINIYEPLFPGRSQKHYLRVGQLIIGLVLATSIIIAIAGTSVASLAKTLITFNIFPGAMVFLVVFWRRLTSPAILISLAIWVVLMGACPLVVPAVDAFRRAPNLLLTTAETVTTASAPATAADVAARKATAIGQGIPKQHVIAPSACFFESVARIDPRDPNSGFEGVGRFYSENYLLHLAGVPLQNFTAAGLVASRWFTDALFPFVLLIAFSLITKKTTGEHVDRFYVKFKTPVGKTPEEEAIEVKLSFDQPGRFDNQKLFPNTNWEFGRWEKKDWIGFSTCWVVVGLIIGVLYVVVRIGAN